MGQHYPNLRIKDRYGRPIWAPSSSRKIEVQEWRYNPECAYYAHISQYQRDRMWYQLRGHLCWYVWIDWLQDVKHVTDEPQTGVLINERWVRDRHRDRMRGMEFFFMWVAGTKWDPQCPPIYRRPTMWQEGEDPEEPSSGTPSG